MTYLMRLNHYYVAANANICVARWFVMDVILFILAIWDISILLGTIAVVASLFSIVQYYANLHGLRVLIPLRVNVIYGGHFKRFLTAHHYDYRKLS